VLRYNERKSRLYDCCYWPGLRCYYWSLSCKHCCHSLYYSSSCRCYHGCWARHWCCCGCQQQAPSITRRNCCLYLLVHLFI